MSEMSVSMKYSTLERFSSEIRIMSEDIALARDALQIVAESLDGSWQGKAHDRFAERYKKLDPKLKTIANVLSSYSSSIAEIVNNEQELQKVSAGFFAAVGAYMGEQSRYTSVFSYVNVNENPSFPTSRIQRIIPAKTNEEGRRSADAYNEVLDSFDVEHRERYQNSNGKTWCNIYVSDVTYAMGCEIPHYYDPKTGKPLDPRTPGGRETSAAGIMDWLATYGAENGWIEIDQATAIEMANQGHPTVAGDVYGHHVAMVAPQHEGESGCYISQAGKYIKNHDKIEWGWGSSYNKNTEIKYYYHP